MQLAIDLWISFETRLDLVQYEFSSAQLGHGVLDVDHYVNYGQTDNANERRVL